MYNQQLQICTPISYYYTDQKEDKMRGEGGTHGRLEECIIWVRKPKTIF